MPLNGKGRNGETVIMKGSGADCEVVCDCSWRNLWKFIEKMSGIFRELGF